MMVVTLYLMLTKDLESINNLLLLTALADMSFDTFNESAGPNAANGGEFCCYLNQVLQVLKQISMPYG